MRCHSIAGGAGVLIEKPLCTTLAEADELVAAAEGGARIAYAENLAHAPIVRLALAHTAQLHGIDLIDVRALQSRPAGATSSPTAGAAACCSTSACTRSPSRCCSPRRPCPWRCAPRSRAPSDHPVDEHAEVQLHFDTGLLARVTTSWRGDDTPTWDAQVSAPDGVVRFELLPNVLLERDGTEVPLPGIPEGVPRQLEELGYLAQIESFALDLQQDRSPELGAAFGRRILDVVCAAYASAGQDGDWVSLPFEGPRDRTPLQLWRG